MQRVTHMHNHPLPHRTIIEQGQGYLFADAAHVDACKTVGT